MKLSQLILALSVSISGAAFAADNHGHDLKPMHGGAVAEAKEVECWRRPKTEPLLRVVPTQN